MRHVLLTLVLIAAQASASARQQASPPAQQPPTFRASTLLIVQTVTVKDKKGQPVAGLTAKDFIVTEDGVPQEIAFVEYQKLDAPPLGATELGGQTGVRPGSDQGQTGVRPRSDPGLTPIAPLTQVGDTLAAVPLPGDTKYRGKRLIVLYIDLSSLSFFDEGRVFDGVRKYVDASMIAIAGRIGLPGK